MRALHVVFQVGDAEYVVPAADVVQMESWQGATPVPGTPPWVAGVVQLRGRVVPVVDLRARFGLPEREATLDDRVVVLQREHEVVALRVDRAREVVHLDTEAFEPPPPAVRKASNELVEAVVRLGERLLLDIDLELVLEGKEGTNG